MSQALSMSIHNATQRSRVVLMEPWGLEFLLVLNEKLEITARSGPGARACAWWRPIIGRWCSSRAVPGSG